MFSREELIAINELINRATVQGREAKSVAILLQKVVGLIEQQPMPTPEVVQPVQEGGEANEKA